jgi:hypothetical protein
MSRFVEKTQRYRIAYGWDRACGVFVQVFDLENPDCEEDLEVDLDYVFDGLTLSKCVEIARKYGARRALSRLLSAPLEERIGIWSDAKTIPTDEAEAASE